MSSGWGMRVMWYLVGCNGSKARHTTRPLPTPPRAKIYDARHATEWAKWGQIVSFPDMHFENKEGNDLRATSIETCTNKISIKQAQDCYKETHEYLWTTGERNCQDLSPSTHCWMAPSLPYFPISSQSHLISMQDSLIPLVANLVWPRPRIPAKQTCLSLQLLGFVPSLAKVLLLQI